MVNPERELERQLAVRPSHVLVIAGTGVSLATCENHTCASWKGLLANGLDRCEQLAGTPTATLKAYREVLQAPDAAAHALIGVGGFITAELKSRRPGAFGGWLSDALGSIQPIDVGLVDALASLGANLSTTNYDNLIEDITGRAFITWQEQAHVAMFLREPSQEILHLHGHYRRPESVILSTRTRFPTTNGCSELP